MQVTTDAADAATMQQAAEAQARIAALRSASAQADASAAEAQAAFAASPSPKTHSTSAIAAQVAANALAEFQKLATESNDLIQRAHAIRLRAEAKDVAAQIAALAPVSDTPVRNAIEALRSALAEYREQSATHLEQHSALMQKHGAIQAQLGTGVRSVPPAALGYQSIQIAGELEIGLLSTNDGDIAQLKGRLVL